MSSQTCQFSELPDDLQVLVFDLVEYFLGEIGIKKLMMHLFHIHDLPMSAFPEVEMWTDYRNEAYSTAMIGRQLPPVIICRDQWLDGRNRVWAARKSRKAVMASIDLAEIGFFDAGAYLGKLCLNASSQRRISFSLTALGAP